MRKDFDYSRMISDKIDFTLNNKKHNTLIFYSLDSNKIEGRYFMGKKYSLTITADNVKYELLEENIKLYFEGAQPNSLNVVENGKIN